MGYYNNGNGKDLGNGLIFRVGAELAYGFESEARLGITFHHISNTDTGEINPGAEMIGLFFSYPLERLF